MKGKVIIFHIENSCRQLRTKHNNTRTEWIIRWLRPSYRKTESPYVINTAAAKPAQTLDITQTTSSNTYQLGDRTDRNDTTLKPMTDKLLEHTNIFCIHIQDMPVWREEAERNMAADINWRGSCQEKKTLAQELCLQVTSFCADESMYVQRWGL